MAQGAPPSNDAFAAAEELTAEEESRSGSTLGATKEIGEPAHAGNPGGASVWYQWTSPALQLTLMQVCTEGWDALVGVYRGDSLTSLVPVASSSMLTDESCQRLRFRTEAMASYRIAVDGDSAGGTDPPEQGPFTLGVRLLQSIAPDTRTSMGAQPFNPPTFPDTRPPNASIRKLFRGRKGRIGFQLASSESGATLSCRMDKEAFVPCASPTIYDHLRPGWHRFTVGAVDGAGNVDPTPAVRHFRVSEER